jgi:hypothetical protein
MLKMDITTSCRIMKAAHVKLREGPRSVSAALDVDRSDVAAVLEDDPAVPPAPGPPGVMAESIDPPSDAGL